MGVGQTAACSLLKHSNVISGCVILYQRLQDALKMSLTVTQINIKLSVQETFLQDGPSSFLIGSWISRIIL